MRCLRAHASSLAPLCLRAHASSLKPLAKCSGRMPRPLAGPEVEAFLNAFLPTLALLIFMALLPSLLLGLASLQVLLPPPPSLKVRMPPSSPHVLMPPSFPLASLQGLARKSETQAAAFKMLAVFQFVWVFLGVAITRGLMETLSDALKDPGLLLDSLGRCAAVAHPRASFTTLPAHPTTPPT